MQVSHYAHFNLHGMGWGQSHYMGDGLEILRQACQMAAKMLLAVRRPVDTFTRYTHPYTPAVSSLRLSNAM